jgi:hypothetical protein
MKTYWWSGGVALRILWPRHWIGVVSFTLRSLYHQRKSPWYPFDRRLGVYQSRSGRGSEEKNSHSLPGFEPPIIQLEVRRYTIELSQLLILIGAFKLKWHCNYTDRLILVALNAHILTLGSVTSNGRITVNAIVTGRSAGAVPQKLRGGCEKIMKTWVVVPAFHVEIRTRTLGDK